MLSPSTAPNDFKSVPLATLCEPHPFAPLDDAQERVVCRQWACELMNAPRDMCTCISLAQISDRIHPGSYDRAMAQQCGFHLVLFALLIGEYVVGHYCVMDNISEVSMLLAMGSIGVVVVAIATFWAWQLGKFRTSARDYFHIDGSQGDDCCVMCCCTYRAVTQMKRQLETMDELPAYQA